MTINFPDNPGYGDGLTSTFTYSADGIVQSWYWGETGDNPIEAWIPFYSTGGGVGGIGSQGFQGFQGFQGATGPPGNGGAANPEGPDGSVQFNDSNSLSGIAEVGVFTNEQLNPSKGLSANFLQYSESISSDAESNLISEKTLTLEFGRYNIYSVPNIRLDEGATFTVEGLVPTTGASLSLILGHTGASGSKIQISNMGIYWADGPLNGSVDSGLGYTAYIYPNPLVKKYDILYFFSDGNEIFGNHQRNYIDYR